MLSQIISTAARLGLRATPIQGRARALPGLGLGQNPVFGLGYGRRRPLVFRYVHRPPLAKKRTSRDQSDLARCVDELRAPLSESARERTYPACATSSRCCEASDSRSLMA